MHRLSLGFCIAGVALHLYTTTFQTDADLSPILIGWFLWSCAPYAVALVLLLLAKKPALTVGYAAASLGLDIFTFVSVFIGPASSTAALGLIVMPFWNLVLFGPVGALITWLLFRVWLRRHDIVTKCSGGTT
jgi:hypothetical protein